MRKISKKGFTLVELLAVIVILAVIAVIAVPQVLKIIEKSRKDAFDASLRSAVKAAEIEVVKDTTGKQLGGALSNLDIKNNPFINPEQGSWFYDREYNAVVIVSAKTANFQIGQVANKNIDGVYVSINDDVEVFNPTDNSILANVILQKFSHCEADATTSSCIVSDDELINKGYIRGPREGVDNYVSFGMWNSQPLIWRIVRVNSDGSMLLVTNKNVITTKYDELGNNNNFAYSSIKAYLNNEGTYNETGFYNIFIDTINNKAKGYIKRTEWDTRCVVNTGETVDYTQCLAGPTSTIEYVGLLTYYDFVYGTNKSNYLTDNLNWWTATGNNIQEQTPFAWIYVGLANNIITYGVNKTNAGLYPAISFNPGVKLADSCISGETICSGTIDNPYKIEQ